MSGSFTDDNIADFRNMSHGRMEAFELLFMRDFSVNVLFRVTTRNDNG